METWANPFDFFINVSWAAMQFHLIMYIPMWATKMGRWSEIFDGSK